MFSLTPAWLKLWSVWATAKSPFRNTASSANCKASRHRPPFRPTARGADSLFLLAALLARSGAPGQRLGDTGPAAWPGRHHRLGQSLLGISHQGAIVFLNEGKLGTGGLVINDHEVSQPDLAGSYEVGQRKHEVAFDGALQVAGSELGVRSLT